MDKIYIIMIACCLVSQSYQTYYPKEFDISMMPEARNCNFKNLSDGMCTGANWAQIFSQGLYLSRCIQSFESMQTLSSEQLLLCIPDFGQDRCSETIEKLDFIDTIAEFMKTNGLTSSTCLPFQQYLTANLKNPQCPSACNDGSTIQSAHQGTLRLVTEQAQVKDQLESKGPAIFAIKYKSSLNQHMTGEYIVPDVSKTSDNELDFGIRFLLVTGWKTNSKGQTVWTAFNTFGEQWANQGKFDLPSDNPYIIAIYLID